VTRDSEENLIYSGSDNNCALCDVVVNDNDHDDNNVQDFIMEYTQNYTGQRGNFKAVPEQQKHLKLCTFSSCFQQRICANNC
jgi:hypothetical protein